MGKDVLIFKMKCSSCKEVKPTSEFTGPHCLDCPPHWESSKHRDWATTIVNSCDYSHWCDGHVRWTEEHITVQWLRDLSVWHPRCHYCAVPVWFGVEVTKTNPDAVYLDRRDATIPYNKDNVVVGCIGCKRRCPGLPCSLKIMSRGGLVQLV